MGFNPLVLVEGMNLFQEEVTNQEAVNRIEKSIISVFSPYVKRGMTKDDVISHFSADFSVAEKDIPIVFRVTVFPSDCIYVGWMDGHR